MLHKMPKVILAIEDSSAYCRDLIKGILRYASIYGPWVIYRDIHDSSYGHGKINRKEFYDHIQNIDADGLITRNPAITKILTQKGIPTIEAITSSTKNNNTPKLHINHTAVGKTAAQYFIERGYRNYAFYGNTRLLWAKLRYNAFCDTVKKAKYKISCYNYPPIKVIAKKGFGFKINHLAEWLKTLEKPVALMACSDAYAVNVMEAARVAKTHIPEQVSLVGVDNDIPVCDSCFPKLSSIALTGEQSGFKMAELLDKLMKGEKKIPKTITVEPTQVVTRASTDSIAVEDDDVAQAMQFIRANKQRPIQVVNVAEKVNVSLKTLQNKFKKYLNSTILEKIKDTRINYAKELLLDTDMNISEISDYLSFSGLNGFSRYFKDNTGYPPLVYRRNYGRGY